MPTAHRAICGNRPGGGFGDNRREIWYLLMWLVRLGVARPPLSLYLPSHIKLWCMFQLRGQIHSPYVYTTPICTLWDESQQILYIVYSREGRPVHKVLYIYIEYHTPSNDLSNWFAHIKIIKFIYKKTGTLVILCTWVSGSTPSNDQWYCSGWGGGRAHIGNFMYMSFRAHPFHWTLVL